MSHRANTIRQTRRGGTGPTALSLPSLLSVLFLLTSSALLVFAVADIRQSAQFADIFLVAKRLEQSGKVSPEILARTAANTDAIVSGDYCRSDIVMAGATLVLTRLDTANQITDYNAWVRASNEAERYMRHAVSCMPTESNLWLRLAIVRAVIVQEPRAIARLMIESAWLAPVDEVALSARVYFWNRLHQATLEEARTSVESDISLFLKFEDPRKVGLVLAVVSPALQPYIEEAGSKLPPDRKAVLLASGVRALAALRGNR
ncbi:UNVERIFIED_ORG: hypothetical protein M2435_006612 [Rhizobium sophorae]|uniref:hypothetical protein n=1 Tax=Rhizobium leguminosarum TaxID=384 RepID=UPI000DE2813E|nr:hypothetical protein [Rhizobium leguminosarum]MBB4526541.1 hypothetical protein [Rhizobium leguminosarum]MDH6663666.1 hypothetical protein [Rhizobium sophorae]